jgi:Flp pilus assembly CpaF family ATPase
VIVLSGLGWKILKHNAEYNVPLPTLSEEEEQFLISAEKLLRKKLMNESKEDAMHLCKETVLEQSEEHNTFLDDDQIRYLTTYLYKHVFGITFFDYLLEDENIEEVALSSLHTPVYVYVRKQGWKQTNAVINSEEVLMDVVNKMVAQMGRRLTYQTPRINAIMADGSRLHASLPPISKGELTIRKFRRTLFSPTEYLNVMTTNDLALLSVAFQADLTVFVAGNTASGKTSLLNAMFAFVPLTERVVMVEETPELAIPHPHQVRLVSNELLNVTLKDLIYDTLRMRPDRMVVGEARTVEEFDALFESLLSGQAKATYTTLHAGSQAEMFQRFKRMNVEPDVFKSIHLTVVLKRKTVFDHHRMREIRVVQEIRDSEGKPAHRSQTLQQEMASALNLTLKELHEVLKQRAQALTHAPQQFPAFLQHWQREYYGIALP